MTHFTKTDKNRVRRLPKRGPYDRGAIYHILDEALICHVGFAENGQPFVIPINFARVGDTIFLHGAKTSRLLKHIAAGHPVCVEATILDGLVLARSVFHHSVNYRSKEMNATSVVSIKIEEASAKVRMGPPVDDEEDHKLPVWAGILPLHESALAPVRDELMPENILLPGYIAGYSRKG